MSEWKDSREPITQYKMVIYWFLWSPLTDIGSSYQNPKALRLKRMYLAQIGKGIKRACHSKWWKSVFYKLEIFLHSLFKILSPIPVYWRLFYFHPSNPPWYPGYILGCAHPFGCRNNKVRRCSSLIQNGVAFICIQSMCFLLYIFFT